ncbi:hypothetical protein RYA05_25490 [Pseudomonas syringae pv. actinidiae]|uniref:Na+/phosphate symporter n=4 Tax=Pseudomonas syringae group TaxID=136849 RepID=A0A0K8M2A5_PSESF|nr:hypothetical protein [Pseudomonas syringae]EPN55255.1 hypothetical protein A235_37911 [Pseudomonas syringae pv. actinidiae ICMP 19079]EPN86653.1 hypothetical protein A234_00630 [Pseudomonas syringae pv. actinidiae ICMP 19101]OZI83716.1 hypothetical protein CFN58_29590 [Pseudomonas avellanae]AKT28813.1 hypothetical protein IYO_004695 [Pseudomonas syringae pv. actinidiae ICMP 18884]AOE55330.1 hypothetical protein NZ708_04690 [Pseudomonas syringae pv. actinidiae ICMP 18708]
MKQKLNAGVVNAGCLLFFPEQAQAVSHSDVMDLMLYVQLAASKKHPKFTSLDKWNETWLAAAMSFGWMLKASEHVSEPLKADAAETIWSVIRRALAVSVTPEALDHAERSLRKACETPSSNRAIRLLASQVLEHETDQAGRAQTVVAVQTGFVDEQHNLALLQLHFVTRQPLSDDFMFDVLEPASAVGNIDLTFYSLHLMDLVYLQFRDTISSALATRRVGLIETLEEVPDTADIISL